MSDRNRLERAAQVGVGELRRIERALETIASDTNDRHFAGRIRDAGDRVRCVADALAAELDRPKPHLGWLRRQLGVGALALGIVGTLFVDDVSDRVDLIDMATTLTAAAPAALSDHVGEIEEAMTAYVLEMQRLDDGGADIRTTESGEPRTTESGEVRTLESDDGGSSGGYNSGTWNDGVYND